jgi:hypothetical protein
MYKRLAVAHGVGSRRELAIANVAFYSVARSVLKVLDHMLAEGDIDAAHQSIRRLARQTRAIQRRGSRRKVH